MLLCNRSFFVLPSHEKYILFVVNVDWFFISHRMNIAQSAMLNGYKVGIATTLTDKRSELEAAGIEVFPLQMQRNSAGLKGALDLIRQLISVFRTVEPDIVHLVTIKPILLGGVAGRIARVPAMVAAISGLGYVFVSRDLKAILTRFPVAMGYRFALGHKNATIIFQNPDDQAIISRLTCRARRNSVMIRGSGVDLLRFAELPLPLGRPIVLMAARLLIDKGVREFVEAIRLIRQKGEGRAANARFVIVGDIDPGNDASLTESELDVLKKEQIVEIWGHHSNMENILPQATIVVLPSYREGLPKVLIEAAACGRAIITTNVPGCRDAIEDGKTGMLVPPRNANAIADCIAELLEKQDLCAAMGRAGRELAVKSFDERIVVQRHMEIYNALLDVKKT